MNVIFITDEGKEEEANATECAPFKTLKFCCMYDDSLEEVLLLFSFQSPNVTVAANYVQENDLDEEHFLAAGWIELKSKKVTYGSWTCRARYGDDKPLAGRDELLGRIAAALREKGIFPH